MNNVFISALIVPGIIENWMLYMQLLLIRLRQILTHLVDKWRYGMCGEKAGIGNRTIGFTQKNK